MKNNTQLTFIAAVLLTFLGCSKGGDDGSPDPEPVNPVSPTAVETGQANTSYTSAFFGQTRVNGVRTGTPIQNRILTSALNAPWGITSLPDGRLLITEKAGSMRIVSQTGNVSAPITGAPAVNSGGQGGLLGLCISPNFSVDRMLYWAFSENISGGTVTSVSKGRLSADETSLNNVSVIYRANPVANSTAHYGGRILFDQTGNLLVSTGERSGLQTRPLSQSVNTALGKIVRITVDGMPAPGNPLINQAGALPELYSIGHRNPQGLARHPVTGDLWQSEHGPRGGDEINRVIAGANYGWPVITYGIEYDGGRIGGGIQQQNGMEQPVYYWDPVISPSGMTFYAGNRIPEWQNNLFIGALSGQHIVRLTIENNRVTGEERLLAGENQRFRDITQGTDQALYAITDAGRLYKIDR
jgi:glucose/arabinose dehydrogenase